jgi:hypothetical protein
MLPIHFPDEVLLRDVGDVEEENTIEPFGARELRRQLGDVVGSADEEDIALMLGEPG